jgi:C-terminal processing protease CtpA/Prc
VPTGKSVATDGKVVIEGTGIIPDILVPITEDSVLGIIDSVLQSAIETLLKKL